MRSFDRPVAWGALLALGAGATMRLLTLEWGDAYPHLTAAHWFVADEGWYLKGGLLLSRYGAPSQPLDLTAWTHNPLWSLAAAGLDATGARGPWLGRSFVLCTWALGLVTLYRLARTALVRPIALLVCVLVAASAAELVLGRIARPYTPPVTLVLAALWLWVDRPRRPLSPIISLGAAALATATKILFLHGLVAVGALWLFEAFRLRREGRTREAVRVVLTVALAGAIVAATSLTILAAAPSDVSAYEVEAITRRARLEALSPGRLVRQELRAILLGPLFALHAGALGASAALGIAILVARKWRRGTTIGPPSRMAIALTTWPLAGTTILGVSSYQPRRFFLFALPCVAALSLALIARALGPKLAVPAATVVVLLQVASEVAPTLEWLRQPDPTAQVRIARDIARRVTAGGEATVLLGRLSAFVALFDRRIRPLEIGFQDVTETRLCQRVARYRPEHALLDGRDDVDGQDLMCPGLVTGVRTIATYRRRGTEPTTPIVLVRLEYPEATSASSSSRTSPRAHPAARLDHPHAKPGEPLLRRISP